MNAGGDAARDRVLAAVRARLGRRPGDAVPPPPQVPLLGTFPPDAGARVRMFSERLAAVGGHCHDGLADGGRRTVVELLRRLRPRSIARSDAERVATIAAAAADLPWLPTHAGKADLFAADVGVTTAQWGIAETGTLVLDAGVERSRLASLLPPLHIALLPVARLLSTLGELLKTLGDPVPSAVTFVTGPSRTADIELQLVVGVHGPKELHVVLV